MTVPQGALDYQGYAQWRGPVLIQGVTTFNNGAPFQLGKYLTNFGALSLDLQSLTGPMTVFVAFFTDNTLLHTTSKYSWVMVVGNELHVTVPCNGNFVAVTITTPSIPNVNVTLTMATNNIPVSKPEYQFADNSILQRSVSVPANTTQNFLLPEIAAGELVLTFFELDNAGKLSFTIQELNLASASIGDLWAGFAPTVAFQTTTAHIAAGSNPIQLSVFNNDLAAPHVMSAAMRTLA